MLKKLSDWLDDRTGYRQQIHEALYENIPGGSRWIYITGSMLVFAFVTQAITGLFLWMFYSAGSQNAWESVYWIQNEVYAGWFLRGVHHYMAQAMVALLPLHMLQVIICRAYVAPREINYWLGLILLLLTLGLGLTGYLLPWDQKGYWATKVATELMSLPPGGEYIQKLVVGGGEYGHYTLTRFFAMHAGVLPVLLIGVLGLHVAMFRKHGITPANPSDDSQEYFWPMQVLKDGIGCFILALIVVGITLHHGGADLGPPAEPTEAYGAARPEWYYLFLFQWLKHAGNLGLSEFMGAIVVPGLVMGFLFLMPLIANIKFGHIVNVVVMLALIIGAGYLTYEAIDHDNYRAKDIAAPTVNQRELLQASDDFHVASSLAAQESSRARELIKFYGIPKEGATVGLIRNDPEIQGPRIFMRNCASCHSYTSAGNDVNLPGPNSPRDEESGALATNPAPFGAPDLYGFGSKEWLTEFLTLEGIQSDKYYGQTHFFDPTGDSEDRGGEMIGVVEERLTELDDAGQQELQNLIATLSAQAELTYQMPVKAETLELGNTAMTDSFSCTECHGWDGEENYAPDLTGYGSADWLRRFISNPNHFYDPNDRMPSFAEFPEDPAKNQLTANEIELLVRWFRRDAKQLSVWERIHSGESPAGLNTDSTAENIDVEGDSNTTNETPPASDDADETNEHDPASP